MTDEEFVRAHWAGENALEVLETKDPMPEFCSWSVRIRVFGPTFYRDTLMNAWAAAAAFTRERLEQVRQIEDEIVVLGYLLRDSRGYPSRIVVSHRIQARLQAALADAKRGMK
jgi:hypothetical protein